MPTRQEALKRFKIEVTSEQDIASAVLRRNRRTYKGHGDDYAVVEQGLMARGAGSGVVMQGPVRARRRTLVLHTPPSPLHPSTLPPSSIPSAGPRDGGRCKSGLVSLTTAGSDVGCRVFRSLLRPELAPFSAPVSGKPALHRLPCDGRWKMEGRELHLRTDPSSIEAKPQSRNFLRSFTLQRYILQQM